MSNIFNREASVQMDSEITKDYKNVVKRSKKPKILICTPEITELPEGMGNAANLVSAKGGGLGDISASLVHHLDATKDYELHICLPKYDTSIKNIAAISTKQIDRLAVVLSGRGIHLVNDSAFSYINTPYAENSIHTPVRRSLVYQRYVINNLLDFIEPDIIHCNDWMTGLIPAAAKAKGIKSLFTLHNIFTSKQSLMEIELSGIKPLDFAEHLYFEDFPGDIKNNWHSQFRKNKVDFTVSAVFASDFFNTVSPTFLKELRKNTFSDIVPESLYNIIKDKCRQKRAVGILNAPSDTMNPRILNNIVNFTKHDVAEKKALNKKIFQEKTGLTPAHDKPLIFWPSRLYDQKAPDLFIDNVEYFLKRYDFQIAFVANGELSIEKKIKALSSKYSNIAFQSFEQKLSDLGKAGADFILMPSRYEPCGLPQMEAIRFGTLPIVRATGGLKDTIQQLDVDNNSGNGFVFDAADKSGLEHGIREALNFYKRPFETKISQIQRIMSSSKRKYNLKNTARKYIRIYEKLLSER